MADLNFQNEEISKYSPHYLNSMNNTIYDRNKHDNYMFNCCISWTHTIQNIPSDLL